MKKIFIFTMVLIFFLNILEANILITPESVVFDSDDKENILKQLKLYTKEIRLYLIDYH
jgi:hypothetical protein